MLSALPLLLCLFLRNSTGVVKILKTFKIGQFDPQRNMRVKGKCNISWALKPRSMCAVQKE